MSSVKHVERHIFASHGKTWLVNLWVGELPLLLVRTVGIRNYFEPSEACAIEKHHGAANKQRDQNV